MIIAHILATVAKDIVKRRVDRTRPRLLIEEGRYVTDRLLRLFGPKA
ncbi:hypothetical protein IC614_07555 [Allosphingosinicella flava]|uniref:Uncharacterized protein n=1 Tax=Allosphingosinicella flava TaxID=2771430 RepID=A0A7T2LL80_9SPHN|nr:hypothetical protein [Sphingosinicella flava]QPQ54221.1 hypothetical protein IC614_07555 [Sphingosinicella flava]